MVLALILVVLFFGYCCTVMTSGESSDGDAKEDQMSKVVTGYYIERTKRVQEIIDANPVEEYDLFVHFCKTYPDVSQTEVLAILEGLALKKKRVGPIHELLFKKLDGFKTIDKEQRQAIFDWYNQYLEGAALDPIIAYLSQIPYKVPQKRFFTLKK
jgi:hypothetical protein